MLGYKVMPYDPTAKLVAVDFLPPEDDSISASTDRSTRAEAERRWLTNQGCIAWAKAYKDIFGGKLVDVVEPEPDNTWAVYPGMPHHVVVQTKDGAFHDATGAYANAQELLSFWEGRRTHAGHTGEPLVLEAHNNKRAKDQKLVARPSDYSAAYNVIKMASGRVEGYRVQDKALEPVVAQLKAAIATLGSRR